MAAVHLLTLEEAILRSEVMTDEWVQYGNRTVVGTKRKKMSGASSNKKVWRSVGKRHNGDKAFAVTDVGKKEYVSPHPMYTKSNLHHADYQIA